MKALLLIPILSLPLLLTGCETTIVDRHPRRSAYVERDVRYTRYDNDRRYRNERDVVVVNPRARRDVVVVNPRPTYRPQVEVRYYNDTRGRYYIQNGRRIYSSAGVRY